MTLQIEAIINRKMKHGREKAREIHLAELRKDIAFGVRQADRGEVAPLDMGTIKAKGRQRAKRRPGSR